jgi:hypothetical protein
MVLLGPIAVVGSGVEGKAMRGEWVGSEGEKEVLACSIVGHLGEYRM